MNRRQFLFTSLRGAMLGAAIATGLASVKLPDASFVRGRLKAADISRAKELFQQAYREAMIEAIDVRPLALGGKWERTA